MRGERDGGREREKICKFRTEWRDEIRARILARDGRKDKKKRRERERVRRVRKKALHGWVKGCARRGGRISRGEACAGRVRGEGKRREVKERRERESELGVV